MIFNVLHWSPDPELVNIFGVSIRYYGVLFASGLMLCVYTLGKIYKKENIPAEYLDKLTTYCVVGVIIGARLGHCLFYEPAYYLANPIEILKIWQGGLASHGGILGLLTAMYIYSRKTKHSMIDTTDLVTVVAGIAFACIRLGNFMNSEIIGVATDKPWAVVFERVDNIPRHPAQLYEAIAYLLVFVVLITLYRTNRAKLKNGFFFGLGSFLFFTARFLIEFVKIDQVDFEQGMTLNMGQLLSIPFILVGIGFVIYSLRNRNTLPSKTL
jgi:phosphatidylglycerol:prolipoprotein diacylglycerol transferase